MLQPKKPLDLTSAKQILEEDERKPLDLSSAEAILKKKDGTKAPSTSTTQPVSTESEQKDGSLDSTTEKFRKSLSTGIKPITSQKPELTLSKEAKEFVQKIKPEDKKPIAEKRSFLGETFAKLRKGSAQLGADIAATPELVYEVFAIPQNAIAKRLNIPSLATDAEKFKETVGIENVVKDYYKKDVENIKRESELVDKKYQQGIYDSFKSGNYEDGFRQLTNSFSESLPATTSIMVGGAYTKAPQLLTASTIVFGAGKNEMLKEQNPEMDSEKRIANALATGLAQGAFETLGSGSIGSAAKALVEREGRKKGMTILKDGLVNFYKESLKNNPMIASMSGEGIEEWATTVAENSIDVATGVKPQDFNVFEGSVDSFISGVFGGAVFGAGLKGLDKISNPQDRNAIKQNFKKTFELQNQLENPNISEPVKIEIEKSIKAISKETQDLIGKNIDNVENLPQKVKEKLVDSTNKIDEIKKKAEEVKIDQNTSDASKQILLDSLKKEYKKELETRNGIIDGKVTEVDVLPLKEQDKIKREALKELTAELNPDGTKNITISDEQITERANKIYKKQQESELKDAETKIPTTETKIESKTEVQEQPEVKEEIVAEETVTETTQEPIAPKEDDEVVLEPRIKGGLPRTIVFKDGEWQQKVGGQISPISESVKQEAQIKFDETQTQGDITPDANVRPAISEVGEMAVTEQPTAEVAETEVVESAVEPRASKEYIEVKEVLDRNETPIDIDQIKEGFILHRGSFNDSIEGFNSIDKEGGVNYSKGGGKLFSSSIKKGAKILRLVKGNSMEYEDNLKDIDLFYKIIGENERNKKSEWIDGIDLSDITTRLWDNKSAVKKLKQAGIDIVIGGTIDGVDAFVVNKDALQTISQPTRKETETKISDATKQLANKVREFKTSRPDIFSTATPASLAWDLGVETVAKSIELSGNVAQAVADGLKAIKETDWYKSLDKDKMSQVDSAFEQSFSQLQSEPKKETVQEKIEPKPRETFVAEQGKHSVLLRLSKGDNPQREIDAINKVDFDYDVRNQEKANREAENFVKDVGIAQAYKAIKDKKIDNFDTIALIYNAIIQQMPKEHDALIAEMTNADDIMRAEEAYANEFAQVSKEFSVLETRLGQGISVMNYIYNKNEDIRYQLERQKRAYKASNNGVIPQDVLEKYEKASKRLEEVNKLIKEKEAELSELENTVLVQEIEKSIKRQKQVSKTKPSLTDAEKKRKRELSKKFFGTFNDVTRFAVIIADPEFREYLGLSFKEVKGDLANFTNKIVSEIGEGARNFINEMFDVATEVDNQSQANSIKLSKDGRITVPKSVIENLIEKGFDNINSISEEVLRLLQEKHPDLTLRQVKESIVGYGRDVAKTRSDIEIEIGRLKRIGQLELEIEDLENGIVKIKNEKKQADQSVRIQNLRAKKRQLEDDLGITEEKRIQRTKDYTQRRIVELKKRIAEGDFAKKEIKPVKQDAELRKLRAERLELQEIFDKERYKLELKNRSVGKKLFDGIFDVLNIKRVGLTTGEFSPMFVQGGALTVRNILRNPSQFAKDFKGMMKSMANTEYYKDTEAQIKSSEIFDIAREAKLGIVETDTKQSAREELFQHQVIESVFDYIADESGKLLKSRLTEKYGEKRADEIAENFKKITKEYVLILRPFERANNAYMNSLRFNRFQEGVKMLEAEGKNPIDNLEDYKRVASAINTLTGRSNLGVLEQYKQGLGLIFFSAKLMASTWQKVNPMHYWALRDSENWKKPSVAQKMLFVDALTHYTFMASITLLMKAVYNALKDDDEEEATVQIDPRSSDFMKFKVGNARLDYFGTGLAPFVLFSRMYTEEVMKADGEIYKMGESGTKSRGDYLGTYFVNKLNPLTAGVYKQINTTEKEFEGKTFREDDWGRDFDFKEYITDVMPIIYGTGKEVLEEQPNLFGGLIMLQAAFGVNPSVYGNEDKAIKNEPDLDEEGNPRESSSRQRPTRPSMPKRPERP